MTVFQLYNHIYLNNFNGCYEKIIIINRDPKDDKLKKYIKVIKQQTLSPFKSFDCCEEPTYCTFAFINPKTNKFIKKREIDLLFTILIDNGYSIQYEMTKLFNNNSTNPNPNLICFISKN